MRKYHVRYTGRPITVTRDYRPAFSGAEEVKDSGPMPVVLQTNTIAAFAIADISALPLTDSPSPLRINAWESLLVSFQGRLPSPIIAILRYEALLGYKGTEQKILSQNLASAGEGADFITRQIASDLASGRIEIISGSFRYILSPLSLVPRHNSGLRRIRHLSYPGGRSVNNCILESFVKIHYSSTDDVAAIILAPGRGSYIVKKDIRVAFRIVPVAASQRWLLGFTWERVYYREKSLLSRKVSPFLVFPQRPTFLPGSGGAQWILCHYLP